MVVSKKKPIEELMAMLGDAKKVGIVGCKSCASACAVGGDKECNEMKAYLEEKGIEVVGIVMPDESCHKMLLRKEIKPVMAEKPDAIISMACGSGCQTVAQNVNVPVYPANNTFFVGQTERVGMFNEMCRTCGDCVLGQTGGICPITKCAKSLVNGPCGGQKNGKCEVDPSNDCAWILIYKKLQEIGQLNRMETTLEAKDNTAHMWPMSVNTREVKR